MPERNSAVTARVVHVLPGRVRLRFGGMTAPDLLSLREQLASVPGVAEVRADTRTGSVLIRGEAVTFDAVAAASRRAGLALAMTEEPRPLIEHLLTRFDTADDGVRRATGGRLDLASIAVLALLGTASVQMVRGQFAAPAITILWYAASTVVMARSLRGSSPS